MPAASGSGCILRDVWSPGDEMAASTNPGSGLTYQVDEQAPLPVVAGVGLQYALLGLTGRILMPTVAFRAAGASEEVVTFAVCASLVICGAITALHAHPLGRFGAGYVLTTGPAGAAIAVTVDALKAGGTSLLAMLAITAAAMQMAFALRMSVLRRLLTPAVSGTALMLVSVTIFPVMFGLLDDVPAGTDVTAAPVCAGVALVTVGGISFKGTDRLRAWGPAIGIVAGSAAAALYGLYDYDRVAKTDWFGTPTQWPAHFGHGLAGIDFAAFVTLLPAFALLFFVCTIRSMSSALSIQTVSWRQRRALEFRPVQGTIGADALSNLAAGLAGAMPHNSHSGTVARTELTGVAARPVGLVLGAALVLVAFCPKMVAVVLAIPAPVFAGYVIVMIAATFTIGLTMAVSEGGHRQRLIVGLAFWLGTGCQYGFIFPDFVATFAGGMFKSALTTGGLVAIALTLLLVVTAPRRRRIQTRLEVSALPELRDFVRDLAVQHEWRPALGARVDAVVEEALLTLARDAEDGTERRRRLLVACFPEGNGAGLEFIAAGGTENIEDRLAVLGETATEESIERDVSLRLLRHLTTEVRHRQYHDLDVLRLHVDPPAD